MDILHLEDRFLATASGSRINVVADLISYCPGAHVFRSVIYKQVFHCDCHIKQQKGRITLLNATLTKHQGKFWVLSDVETKVVVHSSQGVVTPIQAIEVCSGIGAMGQGLRGCDIVTKCYVDYNPRFCQWLRDHGHLGVVEGNIADPSTAIAVSNQAPEAQFLVGGVACQPFSRLGDRKEQLDSRSESFPAFLRLLHWLQIPIGVMECTSEVLESSWAQGLLRAFAEATDSNCTQKVLHLHRCWPSFRTRWWAVVTQQGIPAVCIDDLPDISFTPGIVHLIPNMLPMPDEERSQIELDEYELRYIHSCKKGIQSCVVEKCRPLATATHSWGSQVKGCFCGCRKHGFSHERLANQGLHGAVCVLPGYVKINGEEVSKLRHLHPQEVALLCGLLPSWVSPMPHTPLRLNLAGVGQLASPLQSGWIVAQVLSQVPGFMPSSGSEILPKQVLLHLMRQLFRERDDLWDIQAPTRYMEIFQTAVTSTLSTRTGDEDEPLFHTALLKSVRSAEMDIAKSIGGVDSVPETEIDSPADDDATIQCYFDRLSSVQVDPYDLPDCSHEVSDGEVGQASQVVESFAVGGGHPGFKIPLKRSLVDPSMPLTKHPKAEIVHSSPVVELAGARLESPKLAVQESNDIEQSKDENATSPHESVEGVHIRIVTADTWCPSMTRVPSHCCVQQVIDAETQLTPGDVSIVVRNSVGQLIPPQQELHPFQRIHVEHSEEFIGAVPPTTSPPDTRYAVLTKQGAWVAIDEMNAYLSWIHDHHKVECIPCFVDDFVEESVVESWMIRLLSSDPSYHMVCSAVLQEQHWFPVIALHTPNGIQVCTNQDGNDWFLRNSSAFKGVSVHVSPGQSEFRHDCGFQTVGWVTQCVEELQQGSSLDEINIQPLSSYHADILRSRFENHLHVTGLAKVIVQPQSMQFGGASGGTPEEQIRQVLEDHGVPKEKLHQRVGMIFEKIGRQGVIQCCRSPRPWQELKSLANSLTPKVQLILPSELAEKIRERVESGASFGDHKKKKPEPKKDIPFPKLQPEDLSIPPAVFKQGQDQPVHQVGLNNIGVDTSGVVLVSADQAQPYLKLSKPLSKYGLALLVLDHENAICSGLGEVLRFPARFDHTNEPIIAIARLIQLGQIAVSRHLPATQLKVEEVKTCVARAVVYRDEIVEQDWAQFVNHPVKYIIHHCDSLQSDGSEQGIMDVWDRQFVSAKFDRKKPSEAEMFIVTFRLSGIDCAAILMQSGTAGVYFEPRTQDGRRPDDAFRVTWIPKVDRASALSAVQASPEWATLAFVPQVVMQLLSTIVISPTCHS